MAKRKSHEPDLSQATDAPVLHRVGEPASERFFSRGNGFGDLSQPISSSKHPQPSTFPVDLSAAPRDSQTGKTVAQIRQTVGVPPKVQLVKDETAGQRRLPYLRHGTS